MPIATAGGPGNAHSIGWEKMREVSILTVLVACLGCDEGGRAVATPPAATAAAKADRDFPPWQSVENPHFDLEAVFIDGVRRQAGDRVTVRAGETAGVSGVVSTPTFAGLAKGSAEVVPPTASELPWLRVYGPEDNYTVPRLNPAAPVSEAVYPLSLMGDLVPLAALNRGGGGPATPPKATPVPFWTKAAGGGGRVVFGGELPAAVPPGRYVLVIRDTKKDASFGDLPAALAAAIPPQHAVVESLFVEVTP